MSGINTTQDALTLWQRVVRTSLRELPYDLSQRQTAVLLAVYIDPPPHMIRSVAASLGISKPAICRAVDVLCSLDLIRRKKDETDKRNIFLQRTIAGSVYLRDFADLILRENQAREEPQPTEEQAAT